MTDPLTNPDPRDDGGNEPAAGAVWLELVPPPGCGRHRHTASPCAAASRPPDSAEPVPRRRPRPYAHKPLADSSTVADAAIDTAMVVPPILREAALSGLKPPEPTTMPAEGGPAVAADSGDSAAARPDDQTTTAPTEPQQADPRPGTGMTWLTSNHRLALDQIGAPPPPSRRPAKPPRTARIGLTSTVVLAFLSAFFAWASAEPIWLALGHAQAGTATVLRCDGGGPWQRCEASFTSASGALVAARIPLIGVRSHLATAGTVVRARMVSGTARAAYADDQRGLRAGWLVGTSLILLCGIVLAWAGGATRLSDGPRWVALSLSLAGPLGLLLGMLAMSW